MWMYIYINIKTNAYICVRMCVKDGSEQNEARGLVSQLPAAPVRPKDEGRERELVYTRR